jgi:hypothetical protein
MTEDGVGLRRKSVKYLYILKVSQKSDVNYEK